MVVRVHLGRTLLLLTTVLLAALGTMLIVTHAQQNILHNPGFEGGWYDLNMTMQVPNGWEIAWMAGDIPPGGSQAADKPETRVLPQMQVPEHERPLFYKDGNYCLKIFWTTPVYATLYQDIDLEVGRRYRFVVPIFVDVYDWEGEKVIPW